jgi:hypothetical protein
MLLEPVRIIADWLADASYGINALRLTLDVDDGDAQPGAVVIGDETRDGDVARGRLPAATTSASNLVAVVSGTGTSFEGGVLTTVRDGTVPIVIRIGTPNVATEEGTRDGLYLARVVFQSLKVLAQADHSDDRTRNGIHLKDPSDLQIQGLFQELQDQTVTCAVNVTWRVRDLTP